MCRGETISDTGDGGDIVGPQYEDLFNLVKDTAPNAGTEVFGTDTVTLPDFRGQTPIGMDNMGAGARNKVTAGAADTLGGEAGAQDHTLSTGQMPAHSHKPRATTLGQNTADMTNNYLVEAEAGNFQTTQNTVMGATDNTGGGGSHNNMQPYFTTNKIIKT